MNIRKGQTRNFLAIVLEGFKLSPALFSFKLLQVILNFLATVISLLSTKFLLGSLRNMQTKHFFIAVLLLSIGNFILSCLSSFITPKISELNESLNVKIIDNFLKKSTRIQLGDFESKDFYNKFTLVFNKCCELFQTDISNFFQIISALLQIIITVWILSWMEPVYICILIVFALVQTYIGNYIGQISYQFQLDTVEERKKLNYIYRLFYVPEFMRDIRVNDIWDFIFSKKGIESQRIIDETYTSQCSIRRKKVLQFFVSLVESVLVVTYLGYEVIRGSIWLDTFVVSQASYTQLKNAILSLLSISNSIYENDLYISDYITFMKKKETDTLSQLPLSSDRINNIEFRNVSFSYPNSSTSALQNVSFQIKRGEKVLITGKNGSGKTTLIKLLLRLYEPTTGTILINGIDIKKYNLSSLRQCIAVMFQDYVIYAFSLQENLTLSRGVGDDDIYKVLEIVGLLEMVQGLENGLQTPFSCQLDDGGIELSGGETQRLAIGRTLLKNSSVVVLDEPTSNLDSSTATSLMRFLLNSGLSTLLLISHQLFLAPYTSRILYFDNGKLIEDGTHEHLIKKQGSMYAKLFKDSQGGNNTYEQSQR